jgi:hypothetical protein
MTGGPGRGYAWPPFEAGNAAAESHGATSERRWGPMAARLAAEAVGVAPWLSRPAFRSAVAAWSICEAKLHLVDSWLN